MKRWSYNLLVLILVFALASCGEQTNSIGTDNQENTTTEKDKDEVVCDKKFWVNSIDWSKQADGSDVLLFNDKMSVPIQIETLDEVFNASYTIYPGKYTSNSFIDILNKGNESNLRKIEDEEIWVDGVANISKIYLYNYDDESILKSECYANNWWAIESRSFKNIFNDDKNYIRYKIGGDIEADIEFMDMIINKLGAPTCIIVGFGKDNIKLNSGPISFNIIYKYDEYVLEIGATEQIMPEYNAHLIHVYTVKYYPKECWEQEEIKLKNSEADFMIIENNEYLQNQNN